MTKHTTGDRATTEPNGAAGVPITEPDFVPFRKNTLEYKVEEFYAGISIAVLLAGDLHCSQAIAKGAHEMAGAWGAIAKENAQVKEILERIVTGGAWGKVIMAHVPVLYTVAKHHIPQMENLPNPFEGGLIPNVPEPEPKQPPSGSAKPPPTGPAFTDDNRSDQIKPEDSP